MLLSGLRLTNDPAVRRSGTILSVFLAGVTSVQAYTYFSWFGKTDRKLISGVVVTLLVIDLFHTAISVCVSSHLCPLALLSCFSLTHAAP